MKKRILLMALLTAMLTLLGCGKKADIAPDSMTLESTADALENISVANPMQKLTDEEKIEELSYGLILPKGAEQAETYLISGYMLERRFVVDGADYTMRVAKGDAFEDISGLYYEWNSQIDISYPTEESVHVIYNGDGEFVEAYNWYDKELAVNYSVSVINDKPISNLAICIEQMIPSSVKKR